MSKRKQPEDRLTWRMDPEESMSDWKLEVVVVTNNDEDPCSNVYHVHQCMLGVGRKKSNFFVKLFRGPFSESETKESRMELGKEVADVFPIILDYIYSYEDQLDVTVENIPLLMTLADYLDIQAVRDEIATYCLDNLSIETCAIFHGYGKDYKFLELQKEAIDMCHKNLLDTCPDYSSIASDSRLTFWLDMQEHNKDKNEEYLLHYSRHIAAFCFNHKEQLTLNDFETLTSAESLPRIHYKAAEQLIQVDLELEKQNATKLTELQVRCIDALADAWKIHTCSMDRLLCFSPLALSTLMLKIDENAKSESSRLSKLTTNQVRVSFPGSSQTAAAGVYSLDPRSSYGRHCYFKEGQYQNKQSTFYLYFSLKWQIAVVVQGSEQKILLHSFSMSQSQSPRYSGSSQPALSFF